MARRNLVFLRILRDADSQTNFFESGDFATDVKQVLVPTSSVERYKRVWRLSRPVERANASLLAGKLGFESVGQTEAVIYDEDTQDFISVEETPQIGTLVHYVLDYKSQYMVVETKTPDIKPETVRGALRGLITQNEYGQGFEVDFVSNGQDFLDWLNSVTEVAKFKVSLRRPNPDFDKRPREIRELLEKSNAARVSVDATAAQGESLEINDSPFGRYAEYASDEHGRVQAQGSREKAPSTYDSDRHRLTEVVDISDSDTSETMFEKLIESLRTVVSQR